MDLLKNMLEKLHNYIFGKTGQFMYAAVSDIIDDYHRISDMMDELENPVSYTHLDVYKRQGTYSAI